MQQHTLTTKNLGKCYNKRWVVKDITLSVNSGEIIGLLGPNGAGKTTSFYMTVGLVGCDKGQVKLDDHDITLLPMPQRARLGVGYLPQEASVFRKLSVANNIMAILELRNDLSLEQREQQLETLLDEFHLIKVRHTLGLSLSGGERRRVEIARALASNPKFILLDEPFAGVDPITVIDIKRIVKQLAEKNNIGIIITDHNVRETLDICHQAYIVNDGIVLCQGSPRDVLLDETVRKVYLGHEFELPSNS